MEKGEDDDMLYISMARCGDFGKIDWSFGDRCREWWQESIVILLQFEIIYFFTQLNIKGTQYSTINLIAVSFTIKGKTIAI